MALKEANQDIRKSQDDASSLLARLDRIILIGNPTARQIAEIFKGRLNRELSTQMASPELSYGASMKNINDMQKAVEELESRGASNIEFRKAFMDRLSD